MEVIQRFLYSLHGYQYHVTVARFPNANGCVEEMWRWNEECVERNNEKVYATKSLIAEEEQNILEYAAELWDHFWTVDDLKVARSWVEWHKENKNEKEQSNG